MAHRLTGIGCNVPGPLDNERGVVIFPPNLAWRDVPLAALLSQALDVPATIEDDARCAALDEARRGGARGVQNAVYITISTGIGGGVILNGGIYRGSLVRIVPAQLGDESALWCAAALISDGSPLAARQVIDV